MISSADIIERCCLGFVVGASTAETEPRNTTALSPSAIEERTWSRACSGRSRTLAPVVLLSDCSRCDNNWHGQPSFPPPCEGCKGGSHAIAIRDVLQIPKTLKPGKYVLGWRWDCEATAQVWSNCADVTLVA